MITTNNYFEKTNSIDFTTLPEALQKGNEFVMKATNNGTDWNAYQNSDTIKKTIDLFIVKLNDEVGTSNKVIKQTATKKVAVKQNPTKVVKANAAPIKAEPAYVERIPEELKFIKRFVNMDGKTKLKEEILRFVNSLQKSIVEKKIRKTSSYADQIKFIQQKLIDTYNSMSTKIKIELKPETFDALKQLVGEEKVLASINFIKRYIGLNGKIAMKQKAKLLLDQINIAITKGKITDNDPYIIEIHELKKNLKAFITTPSIKTLQIEQATLNGLEGVLGCACISLNGIDAIPSIMNSMDFANMEFDTIGLQGKWLNLIGDPSSNFTAMVFGKPKMGKSYLCIDFAGYLARNHGKVLYVAKEEGLDYTLQMKLNDKNVKHSNLFVSASLPENLSAFDFIFLDSVNKMGLSPEDLNRLKLLNPTKSFVFIFQSTKGGNFRGANSFQHDVDIVIEVPERGKAVQMGRFNQGGEMEVF
jgi:hypothetical protein